MHDFRGITGQCEAFYAVLFSNNLKHASQFLQSLLARGHDGVTSLNRGDFSDPASVLLAIQDDLVVVKLHESVYLRRAQPAFDFSSSSVRAGINSKMSPIIP